MIGRLFNCINDMDLAWVGFGKLRPAKDQDMRPRVVLILSLFYAPIAAGMAVLMAIVVFRAQQLDPTPRMLWMLSLGAAGLYVLVQSLSAFFWNRRARQLRHDAQAQSRKS